MLLRVVESGRLSGEYRLSIIPLINCLSQGDEVTMTILDQLFAEGADGYAPSSSLPPNVNATLTINLPLFHA
jgi:hypothetical protein